MPLDIVVLGAQSDLLVSSQEISTLVVFKDSSFNSVAELKGNFQGSSDFNQQFSERNHCAHSLAEGRILGFLSAQ